MKDIMKKIINKENFRMNSCSMYKKYSGISIVKLYDNVVYYNITYLYDDNRKEMRNRKLEF